MKNLVIIGNGNFARQLNYYITEYDSRRVAAFSVDSAYITENRTLVPPGGGGRVTTLPFESIENELPPDCFEVILGMGYSKMNQVRRNLFLRCKQKGYTVASFVHPTAVISKGVQLGEGNIVLEQSVIQPFVRIGKGNLIWHSVKIAHDNAIGDFNTLCQNTSIAGASCVGDNCFLGNSCTVFGGLSIADYTLAGAGSVIKKDTKPYEVTVPARSISLNCKKSTDYI